MEPPPFLKLSVRIQLQFELAKEPYCSFTIDDLSFWRVPQIGERLCLPLEEGLCMFELATVYHYCTDPVSVLLRCKPWLCRDLDHLIEVFDFCKDTYQLCDFSATTAVPADYYVLYRQVFKLLGSKQVTAGNLPLIATALRSIYGEVEVETLSVLNTDNLLTLIREWWRHENRGLSGGSGRS